MQKDPRIELMLKAIEQQRTFRELAMFMDRVILENMGLFIPDQSKRNLAAVLARMYRQGGEASLHEEYNRGDANKAMMKLVLETMGCIRTFNPIRGAHHFAQIPKIFTPLRQLDYLSEQRSRVFESEEDPITWSSTDLLLAEISTQGQFLNLYQILSLIDREKNYEPSKEIFQRIGEILARAYSHGGELSLAMEVANGNADIMTMFKQSKTCIVTKDEARFGVFYQFQEIFSPHRILGIPTEPRL
jgi:hypothetical protein